MQTLNRRTEENGAAPVQVKATFLLPLADNDGSDLFPLHRVTEDRLAESFGGFSNMGAVNGVWRMETGEIVRDLSVRYAVVFAGRENFQTLSEILAEFKGKTTQEALYLEVERADVRFV